METAPQLFHRLRQSKPFFLFAGTNVVESTERCLRLGDAIAKVAHKYDGKIAVAFKASWDKANRTSTGAYRGVGMEEGLRALEAVRAATGLPIVTDVHESSQVDAVAQVADIIQIPSFLCRQTDLLEAAGRSGRM
jgi:2-dehydro-3-deoxyphosphooctonate aldolase (KDO 8-P synthase)